MYTHKKKKVVDYYEINFHIKKNKMIDYYEIYYSNLLFNFMN